MTLGIFFDIVGILIGLLVNLCISVETVNNPAKIPVKPIIRQKFSFIISNSYKQTIIALFFIHISRHISDHIVILCNIAIVRVFFASGAILFTEFIFQYLATGIADRLFTKEGKLKLASNISKIKRHFGSKVQEAVEEVLKNILTDLICQKEKQINYLFEQRKLFIAHARDDYRICKITYVGSKLEQLLFFYGYSVVIKELDCVDPINNWDGVERRNRSDISDCINMTRRSCDKIELR